MIAEIQLPKIPADSTGGKDVTDLYDEEKQGELTCLSSTA